MAEHNLFRGGQCTNNPGYRMFPQREQAPDSPMESAAHKTPVTFGLSWGLAPARGRPFTPVRSGFLGQAEYFECLEEPLAVGDVVNAVIMPRMSSLIDLWYFNCKEVAGLEAEIRVRGNAESLGAPIVLATIDFGEVNPHGAIVPITPGGGHDSAIYFDQNDMLQLVFTAVPADFDPSCIRFGMTPIMREYCHGDMIECLIKGEL